MPRIRKKWKRKKKPAFKKHYNFTMQDELCINKIGLLQKIYAEIAKEIFGEIKNFNFGDWKIKQDNIILYIDPEFGAQAEFEGTSNMPLFKRLIIHIRLLDFLKEGISLTKAVELCHLILQKQLKN